MAMRTVLAGIITTKSAAAQAVTAQVRRSFFFYRNSTFIGLLIGYAGYYLCRQNFSVAFPLMEQTVGMDKVMFGSITSFATLMYAFGKFTTGALADTQGGRAIFFVGLAGSVLASLLFSLGTGVTFFFIVWGINRLFQSMGWGGLVNVMSRWFPPKSYGTAMGLMSINYQFGGVVASLFAGSLIAFGLGWQSLFVIPALVLGAIGLANWFVIKGSPVEVGYELPQDSEAKAVVGSIHEADDNLSYGSRFMIVLRDPMFLIMCVLSFVLTLLRECFNTWTPAYFADMGASASTAAFKSAIFPLLGCVGTLFAGWFSDNYLQGRRGPIMGVMMVALALALLGLGHLDAVAQVAGMERGLAAVILVGIAGFFLLGPYSLVAGVVALDFGGRRTAGTAAGLLDSVGYLGATLAGIGVAQVVKGWGWAQAYSIMAMLTLVGVVLCGFLWRVRPR